MRILKPPAVYVVESVLANAPAKARLDRLLKRIEAPVVETISDERLDALIEHNGWSGSRRLSGRQRHGDPPIVFDTYRWPPPGQTAGAASLPRAHRNATVHPWHFRDRERVLRNDGVVCQSGCGINTGRGCLFKCDYCYFEDVLFLNLNLEETLTRLDAVVRATPGPALWKWDNQTDALCFEPEMGAARLFVEYFAQFRDQFLMTYSKTDNVDCLLGLNHNGQTICCWTLNARTQSRLIERDAPGMEERLAAAAKCERAGYRVRFRFSAICPVHNWRAENREMLELLFAQVHPDVITLETLSRMREPGMFDKVMQAELFEPRFVEAIRRGASEMQGKVWGPLPDNEREEIYRFFLTEIRRRSPDTPVSLCQEPRAMWDRLADVLNTAPDHYPCCCAKDSVPGGHPGL